MPGTFTILIFVPNVFSMCVLRFDWRRPRRQHSNMNRCVVCRVANGSAGKGNDHIWCDHLLFIFILLSCSGSRWWSFIASIKLLSIIQTEWECLKWPFAIFSFIISTVGCRSFVLWTHAVSIAHVFDIKIWSCGIRCMLSSSVCQSLISKIRFQKKTKQSGRANCMWGACLDFILFIQRMPLPQGLYVRNYHFKRLYVANYCNSCKFIIDRLTSHLSVK